MATQYRHIENIDTELKDAGVSSFRKRLDDAGKRTDAILRQIAAVEEEFARRREAEAAARAAEDEARRAEEMRLEAERKAREEEKAAAEEAARKTAEASPLPEPEPAAETPAVQPEPAVNAAATEEPSRIREEISRAVEEIPVRPAGEQTRGRNSAGTEKSAQEFRNTQGERQKRTGTDGRDRRPGQDRVDAPRDRTDTRPDQRRDGRGVYTGQDRGGRTGDSHAGQGKTYSPRGGQGTGSPQTGGRQGGTYGQGPKGGTGFVPPAPVNAKGGKNVQKSTPQDRKKGNGKGAVYVDEGAKKNSTSRRTLIRQQEEENYDEETATGYRKVRTKKTKKDTSSAIKIDHAVVTTDEIPIKSLSEKLGISAVDITKKLFREGIMKSVNESLDYDTAALIAADLGIELEYRPGKTAEETLQEQHADTAEEIDSLVPRAPVVTVMGHVDHGKTSLLDRIRHTNVTAGEAGGITQSIGAYTVTVEGKNITFIDTPGHEAFTAMRARGAQVTDIVILVVAADDGIMPQTVEAINHSKAAGVTIIVAINKIDKAGADPDRIKRELMNYDLVPEEWGGDTAVCEISCKTGEGIQDLLETVLVTAEMKELLANPAREASGTIIEARLDKGKGPMATVLVQNGTLRTGDNIISGTVAGKVRAMIDDRGKNVKEAGPSTPVNVLGLENVPNAGDKIFAVSQQLMKQVTEERKRAESDAMANSSSKATLDDFFSMMAEGNTKTLNLIIKGDVQGSVEAVKQSVLKLSNDEVTVKVIHSAAGAINESDVMLADSSNAIILGFNVRPDPKAKALAERSKVDIRTYSIIYALTDDVQAALKGMLAPKYNDVYLGKCEVRQTFRITGVGNVAGCYVTDGKIVRGGKLRIYRDDVLVVEGNVQQLKRFKDDVKEVAAGFECGCAIEGFNDIKVGDIIECYITEQVPAK